MERVQKASEEAAWLIGRGYDVSAVAAFVSAQRELTDDEQRWLSCSAAASANYKHHIARELESDDVARRPLRIDAASVIGTLEAARRGEMLLETEAGVICDPRWTRTGWRPDHSPESLTEAVAEAAAALKAVRPKSVLWLMDETHPEAKRVADAIAGAAQIPKGSKVTLVSDVLEALDGGAFVVSCDPSVLDKAGTWFNLIATTRAARDAQRLRL
jgi:hypothetical protein